MSPIQAESPTRPTSTTPRGRKKVLGRLYVEPDIPALVDAELVRTIASAGRMVDKTTLATALVRVGLAHMDEVAALLRSQ